MNVTCIDPVFGEVQYKHRWYKKSSLFLFDREWNITVSVKAYSRRPITNQQQESYQQFCNRYSEMAAILSTQLIEYINEHCEEFAAYWSGARMVTAAYELAQIVTPKTLLIHPDGTLMLLLDCPWDEHGIAVQLLPDVCTGPQDVFL